MDVSSKPPIGVSSLYTKQVTAAGASRAEKKAGESPSAGPADQIEMSAEARAILKAVDAAMTADEVRWEKVQALKEMIARGDYEIPFNDLAQKLTEDV